VAEPEGSGGSTHDPLLDWATLDPTQPQRSVSAEPSTATPVSPTMPRPAHPGRRRRVLTVSSVVVVLALAGTGVAAATTSSGPRYRTTAARRGDVSQTLAATGVLSPVNMAKASFPVAGRVAAVPVRVGQHVVAGQPLATLDTTSLQASLDQARSTLASAQARLTADLAAQAAGTPSTAGTAGTAGSSVTAGTVITAAYVTVARSTASSSAGGVPAAQQALIAAQHAADLALEAAQGDLATARTDCRSVVTSGISTAAYVTRSGSSSSSTASSGRTPRATASPTATPSASPSAPPSGSGSGSGSGAGSGSGSSGGLSRCSAALQQALSAESIVSTDQQHVQTAATALNQAVSQLLASRTGTSTGTPSGSGSSGSSAPSHGGSSGRSGTGTSSRSGAGTSSGSGAGSRSGSSKSSGSSSRSSAGGTGSSKGTGSSSRSAGGAPVTAAQISADQASVDSAQARLQTATLSLAQASLASPLTGTVGQVSVTPGSTVGAASSTPAVVVVGPGSDQAVVNVSSTDIDAVQEGQTADVVPDGQTVAQHGTVTAIGLLPVSGTTGSGTPSYPVTIAFGGSGQTTFAGSGASVTLHLAVAHQAVTVPTSAVHALGGTHIVTVLRKGKATVTRVQVGAVGPDLTQITSGLSAGDRVVLANMSTPLPTSTSTRGLTGGGGGGGGFGGGAGVGGARAGTGTGRTG
jgi:multidrug efflux pump subunit AcrA (membrane-fusion protein)